MNVIKILCLLCAVVMPAFQYAHAGCEYPDVIWVPVTYYDFHSDRSNPEFEQRHYGMVRKEMVAHTLDADGKPQLGSVPYMNYGIKKWFRPWTPGDFTIPSYTPRAAFEQFFGGDNWVLEYHQDETYNGYLTINTDTSFKNIIITDSLPFRHLGNGVYQYSNDAFFPLDNRGFGNEWNHEKQNSNQPLNVNHNYSFTMELRQTFIKKPGMTFNFKGDDDVWVFLDNRLQLDIGGIHEAAQDGFSVDNISGLSNGNAYSLSVFYAERHSAESHILITTNIIQPRDKLRLYALPGAPDSGGNRPISVLDSVIAGQPFPVYAHVFDSSGTQWLSTLDNLATWSIIDSMGKATLTTRAGGVTSFSSTRANGAVTITARFSDPQCPDFISIATATIRVVPGPPHHVDIQEDSAVADLHQDASFKEMVLPAVKSSAPAYAVVRDSFGNYIRRADASWKCLDPGIAAVTPLPGPTGWKAIVVRGGGGSTKVVAWEGALLPDSIDIVTTGVEQIAVSPNPFIPGVTALDRTLGPATLRFYENVVSPGAKGVLIGLSAKRPLTGEVKVVIYDVTGNVVRDDLKALPAQRGSTMKFGVVWDGSTKRGRLAGPGAYVAVVEGVYRDGSPFYRRIKIGVTR